MALQELIGLLAKIATVALTPILILYALAALGSEHARASREYWGSFWNLVLAAFLLGIGELASFYADVSGSYAAEAVAALLRLAVFILMFLQIRKKLKERAEPIFAKMRGRSSGGKTKAAGTKRRK